METLTLPTEAQPTAQPAPGCPACDAPRLGAFCHECGHPHAPARLTLRKLWRDFAARFLKLENGLLLTFRALLWQPGVVSKAYVEGQRRRYVNPIAYFTISLAVGLLTFGLYEAKMEAHMYEQFAGQAGLEDLSDAYGEDAAALFARQFVQLFSDYYNFFGFLICVPFVLFLRLFFGGAPHHYNLAEIAVWGTYTLAQASLIGALLAPLSLVMSIGAYSGISIFINFLYAWLMAKGFVEAKFSNRILCVIAFAAGFLAYMLFFGVFAFGYGVYTSLLN